jgi:uncharacterized tellurite resistance protein B-like protein
MTSETPKDDRRKEAEALLGLLRAAAEDLAAEDDGPLAELAPPEPVDEIEIRRAATVLFIMIIRADRRGRHDEHVILDRVLTRVLGIPKAHSAMIIRAAEEDVARGRSFADCLSVLDRHSALDLRLKIVHGLWRIALSDSDLAEEEEYLVRKIAEHLHLSPGDLVETKIRALDESLAEKD